MDTLASSAEDRTLIRDAARAFLADHSNSAAVRRAMALDAGYDSALWKALAHDLGWPGIVIPEAHGGLGLGWADAAVLMEEMGAASFCSPFFATVCMAGAALSLGTEAQRAQWMPDIASGKLTGTIAHADATPGVAATVRADGPNFILNGTKRYVVDGATAGLFVVAARQPGTSGEKGISLLLVPGDAPGIQRKALPALDQTRRQAEVTFSAVRLPAEALLGQEGAGASLLTRILDVSAVMLAAEQSGGARRCLEMTVAYVKERVQFGKPIGSFQAIKHRCADMMLQVESALAAAHHAAALADAHDPEFPLYAALAKAYCSEAFYAAAADTIQLHGGMGFTWECDPHIFFKRARASAALLGDARHHRERIAVGIGL